MASSAPVLTGTFKANIDEGGTYTVRFGANTLTYEDGNSAPADVMFIITDLYGITLLVNGSETDSFTAADVASGGVMFKHDGSSDPTKVQFTVYVQDETGYDDFRTFTFNVNPKNDAPVLEMSGDPVTISENDLSPEYEPYIFTSADFYYTDEDDDAKNVSFTISNLQHGVVLVNNVAKTKFTAQQLDDGVVQFVHNGDEAETAGFDILVEDGNEDKSTPTASHFSFIVDPFDDPSVITGNLKATVRELLTPTVTGTLTVTDPDDKSAHFQVATNESSDYGLGTFSINSAGKWTYKLQQETVSYLNNGQTVADQITLRSADDVEVQIQITVQGTNNFNGTAGADKGATALVGTVYQDYMHGLRGADTIRGLGGADFIFGDAGNDTLYGDDVKRSSKDGKDVLDGGAGKDLFWGGGAADTFIFDDGDSALKVAGRDMIKDFSHAQHDLIDLSDIDANRATAKDDAFKIYTNEKQALSHIGSLFIDVHGKDITLYMNNAAAKGFDMAIDVETGKLVAGDFLL